MDSDIGEYCVKSDVKFNNQPVTGFESYNPDACAFARLLQT